MSKQTARKAVAVDYAEAETLAKSAGAAYKRHGNAESRLTLKCAEAVGVAIRTGFIHTDEGAAPEGTFSRAGYARQFYGLANGSLITLWSTLADALDKGVSPDSALWQVLATGAKVARRKGMAEAISKAKNADAIGALVKAEGFDPSTGEKIPGAATRNVGGQAGETPSDPVTATAEAIRALVKAVKRLPAGASPEWNDARSAIVDKVLKPQDKARKTGPFAVKVTTVNADGDKVTTAA